MAWKVSLTWKHQSFDEFPPEIFKTKIACAKEFHKRGWWTLDYFLACQPVYLEDLRKDIDGVSYPAYVHFQKM